MIASGDAGVGTAQCENCGQPSRKRCSRCKAISVCRQACMVAVWRKHKPDCDKVVEARKLLEANGKNVSGVPCSLDPETVMRLNRRGLAVYEKHGVDEPPGRGSKMPLDKKLAFFMDILKVHDTSSAENKDLPLAEKMFLNRRYNNTYRHAVATFSENEIAHLHELMSTNHVGLASR